MCNKAIVTTEVRLKVPDDFRHWPEIGDPSKSDYIEYFLEIFFNLKALTLISILPY